MKCFKLFVMTFLVSIALAQSNICYANCRKGYCSSVNATACSDCDPGLLNINGNCISTNIQPAPVTFLKPNLANTLLDFSSYNVIACKATSPGSSGTGLIFQTQIGNSFTRQFTIPARYSYMRLKFNAILLTPTPSSQTLSLLVNIVPASNRLAFIKSQVETVSPNAVGLSCNTTLSSIKNYYGVFFMDYSISNSNTSIILEVIPQGLTNSYVAVSDFQLYFGNCFQTCDTCVGPTAAQCSSCRGLLVTLNSSSGICSNCPASFYQNVTCYPCPVNCLTCSYSNKIVTCTACRSNPPLQFTLLNGGCTLTQYSIATLQGHQLPFDSGAWYSNQVIDSPISICGLYPLVGGISIGVANSYLRYLVEDLPSHSHIYLFFNLLLIDQTPMDTYQYMVKVDSSNQLISLTIPNTNVTNECGGSQIEYLTHQSINFAHNSSSALITIQIYKSFLGIRDFLIVIDNPSTDPDCVVFTNKSCQVCRNGLIVVNGTCSGCLDSFYLSEKEGLEYCLPCLFTCAKCSGPNSCISCITPLKLDGTFCIDENNNLRDAQLLNGVPLQNQNITWNNYPNLQNRGIDNCGTNQIIGTSSLNVKFLTMNKKFTNLPSHTGALLYFNFYQIDDNYFPNNTLYFVFNGNTYTQDNMTNLRNLSQLQMNLCGNESADSSFVVQLKDLGHTGPNLDFSVHLTRMGKIGLNNIQLYLLNTTSDNLTSYSVQMVPAYSVSSPANKGMQVKLKFNNNFKNSSDINNVFLFKILNSTTSRLLQSGYSNDLIATNSTFSQKQMLYLLNLTQDYNNSNQIQLRPASQSSVFFPTTDGQYNLISQTAVTSPITRYINIDQDFIKDRSSMRNLFNLFRGCAILALFIGMGSFLLGMSAAFDDFLILCQVIFVHIFIQLNYNPPSLRIPFAGLHIVQFLEWLPDAARIPIEKAIIPNNFYQYTPLVYQQYYQDTVFARTIYHTVLYFALFLGLWLLLHVIIRLYDAKYPNEQTKYENYFIYFYKQYHSKAFVLADKIIRFAYFTIVWACTLQFISFANSPNSFHIWNSILTILLFIGAFAYPIIMFLLLYRNSNRLTDATFGAVYEEVRVNNQKLSYYLFRYYKLFIIAVVVGVCYQTSPVAPLIILIFFHAIDFVIIIYFKPLGMQQAQLINATIFYPHYPKVYYYTTLIQQILFIFMEIFFLILVGIRDNASSSAYMGIGYVICAFVILLLLNGLVRLIWGVLKILQQCYLQREANYLSIEKQVHENDDNENNPIIANDLRTQGQLTLKDINSRMFTNKKMSYVSKLR